MSRTLIWGLVLVAGLPTARAADDPAEKSPAVKASKISGELTDDDPKDKVVGKGPHKVHKLELKKDQSVVIRLRSGDFDTYLRIEDSDEKQLADNDDEAPNTLNSKLVFTAKKDDTYRIIATTFDGKTGKYTLTIDPASALAEYQTVMDQIQQKQKKLFVQYQKASEEEKAKILEQYFNTIPFYAGKLITIARENPKDAIAEQSLQLVMTAPGKGAKFEQVLAEAGDLMLKDHLGSKSIAQISAAMGNSDTAAAAKFLKALMEKTTDEALQGQAALNLGKNLRLQSERAYQKNDKKHSMELVKEAQQALDLASKNAGENPVTSRQIDNAKYMLDKLTVGKKAMEVEAEDLDGKTFKLSDYRGKVVVLTFWGSWCPPCRAMIPHERELVKRLEKAPFALIGVNSDKDQETLKEFLEKQNMTWRHFWNGGGTQGPISTAWKVQGWPTIYVLDGDGIIRYREVRGHDMDHAVDELLKELESKK